MKIAVLCQCHKNAEQINRLINAMQYKDAFDFYIHIDKKSAIKDKIVSIENVFVLPDSKRVDVLWGDMSQVDATLNLIECARQKKYDYYWLISGQDFPIKKPEYIVEFLEKGINKNYINFFVSDTHKKRDKKRNEVYYFDFMKKRGPLNKIAKILYVFLTGGWEKTYSIFKRPTIKKLNVEFFFGSSWWCLHRESISWMMEYIEKNPDYTKFFKHSLCPDESFFQTLFMNSPYKDNREQYLTYVNWPSGTSNPSILTSAHKNQIFSSDFLIARKFDADIDDEILKELEIRVRG